MTTREQRGKVIAETCAILKAGKVWKVPSQSGNGSYMVNLERTYCSCPDFIESGNDCKHIYAVRFSITKTEKHADGSETITTVSVEKRKTYRQPSWAAYNAAQVNEHRHFMAFLADICGSLPPATPKPGRPPLAPSDAAFFAIYKVYSTMSARRFMGDLDEAKGLGYVSRVPHFNSVLNFFDTEAATATLQSFIELSAAPLAGVERTFAVDSTGFAGASHVKWFDEKYGCPREKVRWIKLHAVTGVTTHAIVSCKAMDKDTHDAPQFPELIANAAGQFQVDEVSADKAYTSAKNFAATDAIGARFYPAFKKNATGQVGGSYEKAFCLMKLNEEAYAEKYHKRSNIESTFSAVKRLLGPALRSKNELAMKNEALAKCVAYNITCVIHAMYELGIDPAFCIKPRCTNTREDAQKHLEIQA